jgi:hypothetical protein
MFQPYEDEATRQGNSDCPTASSSASSSIYLQLQTCFEFKLKLQLLDQDGRKRMELRQNWPEGAFAMAVNDLIS